MADLPVRVTDEVEPSNDVRERWLQISIQEQDSKIVRFRQDIEDLHKGKILDLEAKIKMCELTKAMHEKKLMSLRSIPADGNS